MPIQHPQIQLSIPASIAVYPPGATFGPRHLLDYELVWIIEGDVQYQWNDTVVEAPPGTLILCRPPGTDFFRWDQRRFTHHAYFHFKIHKLPAGWPPTNDWPLRKLPENGDLLRPLFSHLLHGGEEIDAAQTLLTAQLLLMAFVSGRGHASEPSPSPLPAPVQDALDYIEQSLHDDPAVALPLAAIAGKAYVSPEHLCRLFRLHLDLSPLQTVRLLRLEKALQLVARTNYPLKEIALRCGYAEANHFSRSFLAVYQKSPRQMRTEARSGLPLPLPPIMKHLRR